MECLDHGRVTQTGYSLVNHNGKRIGRHVQALMLFTGEEPNGRHVLHGCDNPRCIEPRHLRWGSRSDNMRDMVQRGRRAEVKLIDVDTARSLRDTGATFQEIANIYGTSRQAVHKLLKQSLTRQPNDVRWRQATRNTTANALTVETEAFKGRG